MSKKYVKLSEVLSLFKEQGYGPCDEGMIVRLCPECEEWTWIEVNIYSGLLNDISDYVVQSLAIENDKLEVWLKTSSYNIPMKWEELEEFENGRTGNI